VELTPAGDDDGDSGEGENVISCALAGSGFGRGDYAGLLVYILLPAAALLRRKIRAYN